MPTFNPNIVPPVTGSLRSQCRQAFVAVRTLDFDDMDEKTQRRTAASWSLEELMGLACNGPRGWCVAQAVVLAKVRAALKNVCADVDDLLVRMLRSEAVLTGSVFLAIFDVAASFEPGDYDFVVSYYGFSSFVQFWIDRDARVVSHKHGPGAYNGEQAKDHGGRATDSGIQEVIKLELSGGVRIDIIRSDSVSALTPIALFHSTIVMNFVSPKGICVAYPTTFFRRFTIPRELPRGEREELALKKYTERGYKVLDSAADYWGLHALRGGFPRGYGASTLRWFGDGDCLMMPFEGCGGSGGGLTVIPSAVTTSWRFGGKHSNAEDCATPDQARAFNLLMAA